MVGTHGQLSRDTQAEWIHGITGQGLGEVLLPRGTKYRLERKWWDNRSKTWLRLVVRGQRYDVLAERAGSEGSHNG